MDSFDPGMNRVANGALDKESLILSQTEVCLLARVPTLPFRKKMHRAIRKGCPHLAVFMTSLDIESSNNNSKRALRGRPQARTHTGARLLRRKSIIMRREKAIVPARRAPSSLHRSFRIRAVRRVSPMSSAAR